MEIKNCPAFYENLGCMSNKMFFTKCENDNNCIMKEIVYRLQDIFNENQCSNCDDEKYDDCSNITCGTYQLHKILEKLNIV